MKTIFVYLVILSVAVWLAKAGADYIVAMANL